ncbi:hypothetical protein EG329_002413 [Mollisiaceae sp. DMI_Dod_QoI]|nr:hypothetical protein EG329_002413 [Helotiales sp. DMI_Dod_QoI]
MGLQRRFTLFPKLPTELRLRIWHLAINRETGPRIIRVRFTARPYMKMLSPEAASGITVVLYEFSCFSLTHPDPGQIMLANREIYYEFRRINPEYLQRGFNGPRIWFNPDRDTILFDLESIFSLHQYILPREVGGWGPGYSKMALHGFEFIQNLSIPLPNPNSHDFIGLQDTLRPALLTGLKNIISTPEGGIAYNTFPGTTSGVQRSFRKQLLTFEERRDGSTRAARINDALVTAVWEMEPDVEAFFGDQWVDGTSDSWDGGPASDGSSPPVDYGLDSSGSSVSTQSSIGI